MAHNVLSYGTPEAARRANRAINKVAQDGGFVGVKPSERRVAHSTHVQSQAYNGPFRLSFNDEGKLTISGGVFEVNGIFMIAPMGVIEPKVGYVYLRWDAENAAITYFIDATLPAMFTEEKLQTPIGQIVLAEDSEEFQIVQWSWDIPSMSNPGQLPAFTSNNGTVSITPDVKNNTVDFSVYTPIMKGSMNNVFEIVKDNVSQQYQIRYKDEYKTVRFAGDLLLYGDSEGRLQTLSWGGDHGAKQYHMVYGDDLHYKLVAPGDRGDFVMVNNRNEGIKWLAVDSFSTGVNLNSPKQTISITPNVSEDGTVSTDIDIAPTYLQKYIESTDGSIKIINADNGGVNLSVARGGSLAPTLKSSNGTISFQYNYDAEGVLKDIDATIPGIPKSGDGVLARIKGVWRLIEMTDGCE